MEDKARLKVVYEGQTHQIELYSLVTNLMYLGDLVTQINRKLDDRTEVKINVNAFSPGSFEVDLGLVLTAAQFFGVLMGTEGLSIQSTITLLKEFLELKKFLKGGKAEKTEISGDQVVVFNASNDITVNNFTFNIYKSDLQSNRSVEKAFSDLAENPEIEAYNIQDPSGESLFYASKEEFPDIARANEYLDSDKDKEIDPEAELVLVKPVFERNRKWEFYYQGRKISATIVDNDFLKRIDERIERFGKGDRLLTELEVTKEYQEELDISVEKSYRVLAVKKHSLFGSFQQTLDEE